MKRLKKELSLLLAFALVLTSIAIGLGQLRTKAATDIMPGTGIFRVAIKIDKNSTGSKDSDLDKHRGTDSDFQLRLTGTDTSNFIGGTAANEISGLIGTGDGNTDPLENDKTTQYICTGGTTSGTASVTKTVASLGTVTVNRDITNIRLKCTTYVDNYKFAGVWVAYYYSGEKNGSFADLTSTGCEATAAGQEHNWPNITAFTTTYKKEITFDANGGSGGKAYDIIQGQTIGNSSSDLPTVTRTGYTFTGWNTAANGSGSSLTAGTTRMGGSNITYYAQWTPITYTVAYNGNGSTGGSTANSSHTYDTAKALTSNGYTRTGHTFAGWNTAANGSGTNYSNGQSVSNLTTTNGATVTLYAKWTTNNYNLTFDANGGTGGTGPTSTPYGSSITAPLVSRTGHTFSHWSPTVPSTMPAANSTYVAQWTVNSYNVTFVANGGTGTMAPQAIPYGTSANLNANTFTRSGYAFTGWNTLANGTGTAYGPGASFGPMTEAGATLYAQWEKSEYDLIFNANGGSGTMTNQTINVGSTAAIKANTFTRTGYSFKNWNTLANGTGTTYANQANFTMGSSDTTLYAQWNINSYTISFNSDGGTAVAPITQNYGTAVTAPANPEKTGYQFSGWLPTVPTTMPANNTNCVAQWTINQYTVSYQSNGGTGVASNTVNYNTSISAPTPPTRTGYNFAGWYTDAGLTTAVSWPYTVTGNVTLYAKWTAYTYTVTYNGNGNTGGSTANSSHTYDVGKALTTNGYIKTGYTFAGWNTAANGSGTGYTNGQSVTNLSSTNGATVTLYAQWTINQYTVSFNSNDGSAVSPITQNYNTTVSAPTPPTKYGYDFAGWYTDAGLTTPVSWPHTLTANVTFYAKWVADAPYVPSGEVSVKVVGGKFVVDVKNPAEGEQYQIWTYQEIISDDLLNTDIDVPANQWLLAKAYNVAGNEIPGGGVRFELMNFDDFHSPTENYLVAVRIADGSGNFLREVRDAYTPENLGVPVITKVLVDGEVTTGYELREIDGDTTTIEVIGNDVEEMTYSAKVTAGKTATVIDADSEDDNKFIWTLSNSLEPGIYIVEVKAEAGGVEKTYEIKYELYKTSDTTDYGYIDNLNFSYSNGSLDFNMLYGTISERNDYGNGSFSYRLREPGRKPFYRSVEFTENDTVSSYSINKPGVYEVDGYVTREGYIGTEANGAYDDGIIRNFVIPRDGVTPGSVTLTLEADKDLPDLQKGVKVTFTALATGLPGPIQYSFWRYDAAGYVLVKDWSQSGELQWTPARVGTYNLQVRAKGAGAGSYEIAKSIEVNVIHNTETKANITNISLNTAYLEANAKPRTPIMLRANATATNGDDLLYKFYVYDKDLRTQQLKGYSVDQTCVWKPRKPGTYTISVLVKNQVSFGKYDAIESFEITVN